MTIWIEYRDGDMRAINAKEFIKSKEEMYIENDERVPETIKFEACKTIRVFADGRTIFVYDR